MSTWGCLGPWGKELHGTFSGSPSSSISAVQWMQPFSPLFGGSGDGPSANVPLDKPLNSTKRIVTKDEYLNKAVCEETSRDKLKALTFLLIFLLAVFEAHSQVETQYLNILKRESYTVTL